MSTKDLFFGTTGPRHARCMIVGEAWGEYEAADQMAFVGPSGSELTEILGEAGISRDECLCTNLYRGRPGVRVPGAGPNDFWQLFYDKKEARKHAPYRNLHPLPALILELQALDDLIEFVNPDIIVGCGNYPSWALSSGYNIGTAPSTPGIPKRTAPVGITSWRGSQLEHITPNGQVIPFVPIIHPAAIFNNWTYRARTVHDLRARVRPILQGQPWRKPEFHFHTEYTGKQVREILEFLIASAPTIVGDIETYARHITIVGLAWSPRDAIAILFTNPDGSPVFEPKVETEIRLLIRKLFSQPKSFVFQNALYDVPFLERELLWPLGNNPFWDTQVFQHTILPGSPKSLDYLSSMYCDYHVYWKEESPVWTRDMDIKKELIYNCKDTTATFEIFLAQADLVKHLNMTEQFQEKMEELALSLDMMRAGFPFDSDLASKMKADVLRQMYNYEDFLSRCIPSEFLDEVQTKTTKAPWYTSPSQQMKIFYDILHFPEIMTRAKKGSPSHRTLDDDALRKLERVDPIITPISRALREYRSLGSYYSKELSITPDPDGCVRSSLGLMNINFRWNSSTNPWGTGGNIQNISKGKAKG